MSEELLPEEEGWYEEEESPELTATLPERARFGAYADFCRRTYEELDGLYRWILERPAGIMERVDEVLEQKGRMGEWGLAEFWMFDGEEMVGVMVFRRSLDENTRRWGGNLQVVTRGDLRNMGYGTEMTRCAYRMFARLEPGAEEMVMTVDARNRYALKMIHRATYESVFPDRPGRKGMPKTIYRITVNNNRKDKEMR